MLDQPKVTADECADLLAAFRKRRPHVHCITNSVAQTLTANVLLAAGASPSLTVARDEIMDFVGFADALLVNLGTMDDERRASARLAVATANDQGKPWVLDPVFVQATAPRLTLARELLPFGPALVRANEAERAMLAPASEILLAVTGKVDVVRRSARSVSIANGTPLMARVTAMGCALTALATAFLAVGDDEFTSTVAALVVFALAGEMAERRADGPGTFQPHLLDALAAITPEDVRKGARIA